MVSTNQSNTRGTTYKSEAHKMLNKEEQITMSVIDGLQRVEECREWISVEVEGQQRKEVIARLNSRIQELEQ